MSKEKAMSNAQFKAMINKKVGEGTIFSLEKAGETVKVEPTSTGIPSLDLALGIGGLPLGRMIEVYGLESAGKCLTSDTRILTAEGYKSIEQIFKEKSLDLKTVVKEVPMKTTLINRYGLEEDTTHFTYNGKKTVYEVVTRTGLSIKGTYKHPLLVLNEQGYMVWRYMGKLQKGDFLVTRIGDNIDTNKNTMSVDEAYFLGLLTADAYLSKEKIVFTNNDPYVQENFLNIYENIQEFNDVEIKRYSNKDSVNSYQYHINSKEAISNFFKKYGLTDGVAKDKTIPLKIMMGSLAVQKSFIRGYFDCEGYLDSERNSLEVASASKELLIDIQLLLKNIGIPSFLRLKEVKNYQENKYFVLTIYADALKVYGDEIGYSSKEKIEKEELIQFKNGTANTGGIPYILPIVESFYHSLNPSEKSTKLSTLLAEAKSKNLHFNRKKLAEFLDAGTGDPSIRSVLVEFLNNNLYFDEVRSVEKQDPVPTFDFAMESTHSFIAESIISHNTTIALMVIAAFQRSTKTMAHREGKKTVFFDMEHALDPIHAKALGVDISEDTGMMVAQPETGEQMYDLMDAMLDIPDMGIMIVDSVPSILPKAVIEASAEDNHMAVAARLNGKMIPQLVNKAHKNGVLLIFINQIRSTMSMYGSQMNNLVVRKFGLPAIAR